MHVFFRQSVLEDGHNVVTEIDLEAAEHCIAFYKVIIAVALANICIHQH